MTASKVIKMLLAVLPDNICDHDLTWEYCWNELSDDAQEQVVEARRKALKFLDDQNLSYAGA